MTGGNQFSKECDRCHKTIVMSKKDGKWVALNTDFTPHHCKGGASPAATQPEAPPSEYNYVITEGIYDGITHGQIGVKRKNGVVMIPLAKDVPPLTFPEMQKGVTRIKVYEDKSYAVKVEIVEDAADKMKKAGFEVPAPATSTDRTSPEKPEAAGNPAPQPSQKDIWGAEREEFCNLLTATGREGMPDLLQWLIEKSDFFLAPSSTKYHDAREGGLLHHSIETYRNLMDLMKVYKLEIPGDGTSLAIIALLHDLCKVNHYKLERKSLPKRDDKTGELVLDNWGKKIWEEQLVYTVEDQVPLGHGEKSVIMLQRFIQLTDTEIFAIRWHMMAYDNSRNSYEGNLAITNASDMYRIIPLVHMADLAASFLERRGEAAEGVQ